MSMNSRIRNAAENALIKTLYRETRWWKSQRHAISFTFDDFPLSAFEVGGGILGRHGLRGTFYASMGLRGIHRAGITYFTLPTLEKVLAHGDELGCHTFDHETPRTTSTSRYLDSIERNRVSLSESFPSIKRSSFSYPLGDVTLPVKSACRKLFASCRSIYPGINRGMVDLGLLRAIPLSTGRTPMSAVEALIAGCKERGGWLIFYTHDVSSRPSPYGCDPEYFETAVQLALKSEATILPVGEIAAWLG